eukprot:TRINITY_DN2596_c0_g2_i4.p1 TRINITY_DN2596_c0_g2~~TRINITY_DN2596_c0_g2_i4.p1  ORF type:complete len:592 (+),score=120.81 TRINITY_DN2596_c0_g2_i4:69-1844(+)
MSHLLSALKSSTGGTHVPFVDEDHYKVMTNPSTATTTTTTTTTIPSRSDDGPSYMSTRKELSASAILGAADSQIATDEALENYASASESRPRNASTSSRTSSMRFWRGSLLNRKQKQCMFVYSDDFRTLVDEHADKTLLLEFDDERRRKSVQACIVAIIGILLMMTECFVAWDGKKMVSNASTQGLKIATSFSTVVLLLHVIDYNRLKAKMQIARYFRGPLKDAEFIYQDRILPFLIEFLVCAWHIPPYIDYALSDNPDKWGIFMFFRLYLLIRPMRDFSPVYINRGRILKSGHDEQGGTGLNSWVIHVRMYFYQHPARFVMTILFTITLFLSFSICIHERENQDDFSFGRSLWYTTITMTTVGYGDTVAVTTTGRILAVLGGVLGIILSSFCVAVTSGFLQLSRHQKFAVDWVAKAKVDHEEEEAAAILVQSWWRLLRCRRQGSITPKQEYHLVKQIIQSSIYLRKARRLHRLITPYSDDPIVMQKLQLEGRFDPILDRVLKVEDIVSKLDWRLKRIHLHINADDMDFIPSYRTLYSTNSPLLRELKSKKNPPTSLAALDQRISKLETGQEQILQMLQNIQQSIQANKSG